jgi:hypothetical protein
MKLAQSIVVDGLTIPAGTELDFGTEGYAEYNGAVVDITQVPTAALESEASLTTKGTLALRGLVGHIASVLDDIPSIDKPELIRILRVASQSVMSGSATFKRNIGRGIV